MTEDASASETLLTLTCEIVCAQVMSNAVASADVPRLIETVFGALAGLGKTAPAEPAREPAVALRASVKADHIACLECGSKMKVMKRHLMTEHQLTTGEYRQRWGLSADYPMVAPDYAKKRGELARTIGLGRKPGQKRGRKRNAA